MPSSTKKLNRIMLVDDSPVDLKINAKIISINDLAEHIILCKSAEAGLSHLRKHRDEVSELPELILLDIQMPEMDGFDFLEVYQNLPKNITGHSVVVILSSTLDFGDIQRAEANPSVLKMLKKPLQPAELRKIIDAL